MVEQLLSEPKALNTIRKKKKKYIYIYAFVPGE
jgi:hypothetical protein